MTFGPFKEQPEMESAGESRSDLEVSWGGTHRSAAGVLRNAFAADPAGSADLRTPEPDASC